jgi:pimeloyl-ACP methyl ester carboxylesterase/predicted neuraminidase
MRLIGMAVLAATGLIHAAPVYKTGVVKRPDGAALSYYVREGSGPNLLLVPGSWGDHRVFDRFVDQLPADWRVIVVELRGHGGSQPASPNPSMGLFAADVLHVVDSLGLRRFYVGGHSIGGMLAIELTGRRPEQVAGAIAMEGWTHHAVAKDAFGGDNGVAMTSAEQQVDTEQRERVRRKLSAAEIAAFASVWKQWDGMPVLQSTSVPVLEVWGDRGRARPSRELMRIPARGNIELEWIAGASHSLLIQRPEAVAAHTTRFVETNEARHMFAVPGGLDISRFPRLKPQVISIYRGVDSVTGFNMHPYITAFQGKLWAMWSCNRIRDLQAGQYIRYSTSADGVKWAESAILAPPEEKENFRSFARGFWVRGPNELIALVARDEAVRPLFGPGLALQGFRWNRGWQPPFIVSKDTINNFAPTRLPSGEWMMTRRDHKMRIGMLSGGASEPDRWNLIDVPKPADGAELDEPVWWALPNGVLTAAFRDGSKSRRLYRSFSRDNGKTWTSPVRTDFPDAMAKFNVLRLSNGMYVMASNPNPNGTRNPLCLSLSADGRVFTSMAVLRDAPTMYRYAGKDPGYAGYHYPQLLEHDGFLYVIHSENMEDIVLLRLPLSDVERLGRKPEQLLSSNGLLSALAALKQAAGRKSTVFQGKEKESGFNLHSYIAHHDGRFWAVWSSSAVGEEDPDQRVLYATSKDGHHWSEARELAADPDGPTGPARWIARGVFVSEGKLSALAAYIESADYRLRGTAEVWRNLRLMRFDWNGTRWQSAGTYAANCMNNFPPQRLNGLLSLVCRDSRMAVTMALADAAGSWKHTPIASEPPFDRMDEPTYYATSNGEVHLIIRDNSRSGFLIRSISQDHGKTWSLPVRTNYPDATSKNFPGRLTNGWYYLINNPNPSKRDPLAISFSRDGWEFERPLVVRRDPPARRFEGRAKGSGSVQYPHAIEHNGSLWVIYSINKEDIEVAEIPIRGLELPR